MIIDHLQLSLSEKELNILMNKYLPSDLPVEGLVITLENNLIKLTGIAAKVVSVPFCVWIKIAAKGSSRIGLKITKIDAVGPMGNMLRGLVWNIALRLIPAAHGVNAYGNRLRINLDNLLTHWEINSEVVFKSIEVEGNALKIILSGNIDPPKSLEKFLDPNRQKNETIA